MVGKFAVVGVIAAAGLMLGGCKCDCNKVESKAETTTAEPQPARDGAVTTTTAASGKIVPVNTMCPLGKHSFNATTRDADTSRNYKGSTIGFCCEDCSHKFDAMSSAEKDQVLAAAKANKPL